jgi:putative ABC transport system permease protein
MFVILENILNSFDSILANKLRSGLSMLWIIIGVSSVIILSAIWAWSQQSIVDSVESLWTNILTITPWWRTSFNSEGSAWDILNDNIVNSIKTNIDWLAWVIPSLSWNWQLVYESNNLSSSVVWITTDYFNVKNTKIIYWNNISEENLENLDKVAVIGNTVLTDLFNSENPVWKMMKMWNNTFEVIWVIEAKSEQIDSNIFIPVTTAEIRIFWKKYYSTIEISVEDSSKVAEVETAITDLLTKEFDATDPDNLPFRIRNQASMLERVSSITWTLTMLLSWIAAISLLVWWIWVMNIMLVSVTERTKEIGIRKAIWASKNDILLQFLTEALSLSVLWWIIWIWISYLTVYILSNFLSIAALITYNSVVLSFSFSFVIWIVFWILPAYKAAKMRPIDALRFE